MKEHAFEELSWPNFKVKEREGLAITAGRRQIDNKKANSTTQHHLHSTYNGPDRKDSCNFLPIKIINLLFFQMKYYPD